MVCYEILTSHLPFYEITMMMELRQKIRDGLQPNIPKQYPTSLITLLENCFHSNPEIRPSFDEICMQLRHIKCSLIVESLKLMLAFKEINYHYCETKLCQHMDTYIYIYPSRPHG
jgi:serine/threonine protein kinase